MSEIKSQSGSFNGIGTDERIVVVPGLEGAPYVAIDAHDTDKTVTVELANDEAVRLANAIIQNAVNDGNELDTAMVTAIGRISAAAEAANEAHLHNLAELLESFLLFPVLKPETLPILLTLTGAQA